MITKLLQFSKSSLDNIDDVVAKFLQLPNEIAKSGACGIVIFPIVDGIDIPSPKTIAHVIDSILMKIGLTNVLFIDWFTEHCVHLLECKVAE